MWQIYFTEEEHLQLKIKVEDVSTQRKEKPAISVAETQIIEPKASEKSDSLSKPAPKVVDLKQDERGEGSLLKGLNSEGTVKTAVGGALPGNTQLSVGNKGTSKTTCVGASSTVQISEGNKITIRTTRIRAASGNTQESESNKMSNKATVLGTSHDNTQLFEGNKVTSMATDIGASTVCTKLSEDNEVTNKETGVRTSPNSKQVSEGNKVISKTLGEDTTPVNTQIPKDNTETSKITSQAMGVQPSPGNIQETCKTGIMKVSHVQAEMVEHDKQPQADTNKLPAVAISFSQENIRRDEKLPDSIMEVSNQEQTTTEQEKKRALEMDKLEESVNSQKVHEPAIKKARLEESSDSSSSSLEETKTSHEASGQVEPELKKRKLETEEEKMTIEKEQVQVERSDEGSRDGMDDNGTEDGQDKDNNSDGKDKDDTREDDDNSSPSKRRKKKKKSYERPRGEGGKFMKERPGRLKIGPCGLTNNSTVKQYILVVLILKTLLPIFQWSCHM